DAGPVDRVVEYVADAGSQASGKGEALIFRVLECVRLKQGAPPLPSWRALGAIDDLTRLKDFGEDCDGSFHLLKHGDIGGRLSLDHTRRCGNNTRLAELGSDRSEPRRKCAQADRVIVAGPGGTALEIRGQTNEPPRQRNQGAALRPPGRIQALALQCRSEPACAGHIVLENSGADRLRWGKETGIAFHYLLDGVQLILHRCDQRIGAIEDAVHSFDCHSSASTYG